MLAKDSTAAAPINNAILLIGPGVGDRGDDQDDHRDSRPRRHPGLLRSRGDALPRRRILRPRSDARPRRAAGQETAFGSLDIPIPTCSRAGPPHPGHDASSIRRVTIVLTECRIQAIRSCPSNDRPWASRSMSGTGLAFPNSTLEIFGQFGSQRGESFLNIVVDVVAQN